MWWFRSFLSQNNLSKKSRSILTQHILLVLISSQVTELLIWGELSPRRYCLFLTTKVLFLDNPLEKLYVVKIFMSSPSKSAQILSYAQSRLWIVTFSYASCSTLIFARDTFSGLLARAIKSLKIHLSDLRLPLESLRI